MANMIVVDHKKLDASLRKLERQQDKDPLWQEHMQEIERRFIDEKARRDAEYAAEHGLEYHRYLGNTNTKEIHDLENEKPRCQINEIRQAKHVVYFKPDTINQAQDEGYDNCAYCIGGSKR